MIASWENITQENFLAKEKLRYMNELEDLRRENAYLKAKLDEVTRERDELRRELEALKDTPAHVTQAVEEWFEGGFY